MTVAIVEDSTRPTAGMTLMNDVTSTAGRLSKQRINS
jgi:hypothetical protein